MIEQFQHYSKYARFNPATGAREAWAETVDRNIEFYKSRYASNPKIDWAFLRNMMLEEKAVFSMRSVQMAGPAAERCNVSIYNCAYTPVESLIDIRDALYIMMQGTGLAFSVENQYIRQLPTVVAYKAERAKRVFVVQDTTESWCDALYAGLHAAYNDIDISFDVSRVRPKGARLATKGGYASGPEPLIELLEFVREIIRAACGRKLTPFEVHRIMCKVGQIVQVGGVRRAAMLSLSDVWDEEMRQAKNGAFWEKYPELTMANNSAAYGSFGSWSCFEAEFANLVTSGSGERGIFNRQAPIPGRRSLAAFGTNPCGEIVLRPRQFCNLSIAIVRPDDTLQDLINKVRAAAIMGTLQAGCTDFRYISKAWRANCKEEALLGVDLQGALDNELLQDEENLSFLKELVLAVNTETAEAIGINRSAATTCIKPSGNSGERFGTGNSITGWFAPFYERRVYVQRDEPMCRFLIAQGVPHEDHYTDLNIVVFIFPKKAPDGAVIRGQVDALGQLEWWKKLKLNWTEHNPSATIYVKDHEWDMVGDWILANKEIIGGLAFLPYSDHVYKQAPFTAITEAVYTSYMQSFPTIDWSQLAAYDMGIDTTVAGQQFACLGDSCTIG